MHDDAAVLGAPAAGQAAVRRGPVVDQRLVHLGREGARADAVDLEAHGRPVGAHALGQHLDRTLGRGVGRDGRPADLAHQRADVDDLAGLARDHSPRHQEHAGEIGLDHRPPVGLGKLGQGFAHLDPGVVDENVARPLPLLDLDHAGLDRGPVGDVEGDPLSRHLGLAQIGHGPPRLGLVTPVQHHRRHADHGTRGDLPWQQAAQHQDRRPGQAGHREQGIGQQRENTARLELDLGEGEDGGRSAPGAVWPCRRRSRARRRHRSSARERRRSRQPAQAATRRRLWQRRVARGPADAQPDARTGRPRHRRCRAPGRAAATAEPPLPCFRHKAARPEAAPAPAP